jgi:hypothetical protein
MTAQASKSLENDFVGPLFTYLKRNASPMDPYWSALTSSFLVWVGSIRAFSNNKM